MTTAYQFVSDDWTDMNWYEQPQPGTVEELAPYWDEMLVIFDHEPIATRLSFRYNTNTELKGEHTMPEMTRSDFGKKVPVNASEIMQFINNAILYQEESVFWSADPADTDRWESDLIRNYLAGDRSGPLQGAPEPIYK